MKLSEAISRMMEEKRMPVYRGDDELALLLRWLGREKINKTDSNEKIASLTLPEIIENCRRCSNISERKKCSGSGNNRVMIVLNAPGLISREERENYRKSSADLLEKIVDALKLKFDECYITNLIKCETSDFLLKPSLMLTECMNIFIREIREKEPVLIIVMGDMLPLQKFIHDNTGISWFNIHHPITMIKNSELKRPAWNTLKLVIEKLNEPGAG